MRSSDCVCGSRLVAAHRRYSGLHEMRGPRGARGFEPRHVCRGAAVRKGATVDSLGDGLKDRGQDSQLAVPEDEGSLLRHTHRIFRFCGGTQRRLEREGVESSLGSPRTVREDPEPSDKIGTTLTERVAHKWSEGVPLPAISCDIFRTLPALGVSETVGLRGVSGCVVDMAESDIHDEAGGLAERERRVLWYYSPGKGHHVSFGVGVRQRWDLSLISRARDPGFGAQRREELG